MQQTTLLAAIIPSVKKLWIWFWTASENWQTTVPDTMAGFRLFRFSPFSITILVTNEMNQNDTNGYKWCFTCPYCFLTICCCVDADASDVPRIARVLRLQCVRGWHWIRFGLFDVGTFIGDLDLLKVILFFWYLWVWVFSF